MKRSMDLKRIKKIIVVIFLLLLFVLWLSKCDYFFSDAVWVQKRNIVINASDFDKCLSSVLNDIPGVEIDKVRSQPRNIVLDVKFEHPIPVLGVHIKRLEENTIQVLFVVKGDDVSDDDRAMVNEKLTLIVSNIQKNCS